MPRCHTKYSNELIFEDLLKLDNSFKGKLQPFYLFKENLKMPKATHLSEFERGEIIGLKKADFSYREIACILNRSKSAVEKTINDYFSKNKTTTALRPGRPKKLSERDERQLTKAVKRILRQLLVN